jgi:hypothetical protein
MEQNISVSFKEKIIHSLFMKEKENSAKKELDNYIYQSIIKMRNNNINTFISNLLISFKNEIFDESKEYLKKLEKDITPILIIQKIIKEYTRNPNIFFILLNPVFDIYKNLEPKQIIHYTEKIKELLEDKDEIILKNFNELFEVVIFLIINQEQSVKEVGESLNNMLKITLNRNVNKLDNKDNFDFESFEKKILEKSQLNQAILDGFLIDWINEICNLETLNIYMGKLFYDIIPWILKIEKGTVIDIANKAYDCDNMIKNIFLNKYLKFYYKENKQIDDCILSFIKLVKNNKKNNNNNSEVSDEYNFLYDLIKKFISIIEDNLDKNNFYDNSTKAINSPIYKRSDLKLKYGEQDINIKKQKILYSPTIFFTSKKTHNILDINKNIIKSTNINSVNLNSFDCLSQNSENKNYEISRLIPLDTLNDFMTLIIECNDISKEESLNKLNSELKKLIEYIPNNYEKFNAKEFINTIIKGVENPEITNKEYLLDWYQLLCEKYEQKISDESITAIINSILKTLQNQSKDKKSSSDLKNENLILLMFKNLTNINIQKIFSLIIDSLNKINDNFFIYQMAGYLNNYLITTPRAEELRNYLIEYGKEKNKNNRPFYEKLYKILAYNPMCLLVFCTVTEYYELSWHLILNLIKTKFDDDYYIYLSEFVLLMENSQSNHIRMLLLYPQQNIYLTKTLYGILMLLPQGKAYNSLSNRLYSIKGLFKYTKEFNKNIEESTLEDIKYFINIFINTQKKKKEKNIK